MNTAELEAFLARLYADKEFLVRFLRCAEDVVLQEDFTPQQRAEILAIDKSELVLAARSYRHKREHR